MIIRRRSVAAALVVALLVAPAVTGCSLRQIVGTASGGNVDLGGSQLPKSFPSEVPLYNGDITVAVAVGNDKDGRAWNVSLRVSSVDDVDAIAKQLGKAGFSPVEGSDAVQQTSADGRTIVYDDDSYGVVVVVVKTNDEVIANYSVTQKKN